MEEPYFKDPCELIEARGERLEKQYWDGEHWICCHCGKPIPTGHEVQCSADPASPMMCRKCSETPLDSPEPTG